MPGTTLREWLVSVLGRWSVVKTLFGYGVRKGSVLQWTRTKNNGTVYFMPDHPLLMRFCLNKVYIIHALYLYTGIRKKTQINDCISNQREQRRNRNRMGRHEFKTQERMNYSPYFRQLMF